MDQRPEHLHQVCYRSGLYLSENVYDGSTEMVTSLSKSTGNEEVALDLLVSKHKPRSKREHASITEKGDTEHAGGILSNIENEEKLAVDLENDERDDRTVLADEHSKNEDKEPLRKISRLIEDIRQKPAAVDSNKVFVNVLKDYGEQHLRQKQIGKGVAQLRAARAICDYPHAITSATEARAIRMVGPKMATKIEHILSAQKHDDETSTPKVVEKFELPTLIQEIQDNKVKCPRNQALVNELAYFGEHELFFRSGSKGMSHLRAARALQLTEQNITSGSQARCDLPQVIGLAIADKIDQILKYGRIVKDLVVVPIVEDLRLNRAVQIKNQPLVDTLADYGSSHLHSGHAGKGVAHLRAAKAIRDTEFVVTSGAEAEASLKKVSATVAAKIDQILKQGHADTDEEDDDSQGDGESEFGIRELPGTPPIVHEVRSKPTRIEENQEMVNALSTHGETQLAKLHTGRGTAFMRAARRLQDAAEVVTNGTVAKALGCIGDKVGAFIDVITMENATEE